MLPDTPVKGRTFRLSSGGRRKTARAIYRFKWKVKNSLTDRLLSKVSGKRNSANRKLLLRLFGVLCMLSLALPLSDLLGQGSFEPGTVVAKLPSAVASLATVTTALALNSLVMLTNEPSHHVRMNTSYHFIAGKSHAAPPKSNQYTQYTSKTKSAKLKYNFKQQVEAPGLVPALPRHLIPIYEKITRLHGLYVIATRINMTKMHKYQAWGYGEEHDQEARLSKALAFGVEQLGDETATAFHQFHVNLTHAFTAIYEGFKDLTSNPDAIFNFPQLVKPNEAAHIGQTTEAIFPETALKHKREFSDLAEASNRIVPRATGASNSPSNTTASTTFNAAVPHTFQPKQSQDWTIIHEQHSQASTVSYSGKWSLLKWITFNYTFEEVDQWAIMNSRGLFFQDSLLLFGMFFAIMVFLLLRGLGDDWAGYRIPDRNREDKISSEDVDMENKKGNRLNANIPRSEKLSNYV